MALGKNKIIVYSDWLDNFEDLTDDELGKLMRHFFMYINDMNPVLEDRFLKIAWKPIETTLKRDLKKWEQKAENSRKNGALGGRPKKNPEEPKKPSRLLQNPEEPKKPVSVSVSVSDTVSDIDSNKKKIDKKNNGFSFRKSLCDLGLKENLADDFLKNRKTKRLANTETAFNSIKKQIEKNNLGINEIFEQVISNGWGSFKNSWLEKEKNYAKKEKDEKQPTINRQTAEVIRRNSEGW